MIRCLSDRVAPTPEYQGARTSRAVAVAISVPFGYGILREVLTNPSVTALLGGIGAMLTLYLAGELMLSRRIGLTITADGLVIHKLVRVQPLSWEHIERFEWQACGSLELLVVKLDTGRSVLVTTVWRANNYLAFLGSSDLRSRTGDDVDALSRLESALATAQASRPAMPQSHVAASSFVK
jgi:hypothetical protein